MPEKKVKAKGKSLVKKIPTEVLLSPGGIILLMWAITIEAIDFIIPGGGLTWKLILDIPFIIFFVIITKASFRTLILPFLIERMPFLGDIVPTWFLRIIL
jgi:hypothetical protein